MEIKGSILITGAFLDKGQICHNIPVKMKHCDATEMSLAYKWCILVCYTHQLK